MLSHQNFPGAPNFEDVRKGDAREGAYILTLDAPACAVGDDFLNASESFDRIQLLPNDARPDPKLSRKLRRLVGKRVSVQGASAFGAHTGHHHAPLLVSVQNITAAPERRGPPQPK